MNYFSCIDANNKCIRFITTCASLSLLVIWVLWNNFFVKFAKQNRNVSSKTCSFFPVLGMKDIDSSSDINPAVWERNQKEVTCFYMLRNTLRILIYRFMPLENSILCYVVFQWFRQSVLYPFYSCFRTFEWSRIVRIYFNCNENEFETKISSEKYCLLDLELLGIFFLLNMCHNSMLL